MPVRLSLPVFPEDAVASCQQVRDRISQLRHLVAESGVTADSKTAGYRSSLRERGQQNTVHAEANELAIPKPATPPPYQASEPSVSRSEFPPCFPESLAVYGSAAS